MNFSVFSAVVILASIVSVISVPVENYATTDIDSNNGFGNIAYTGPEGSTASDESEYHLKNSDGEKVSFLQWFGYPTMRIDIGRM